MFVFSPVSVQRSSRSHLLQVFIYCKILFIREDFIFRVNSRQYRDAKIKSSPIISNVMIIEENMACRKNDVSRINHW